MIFYTVPVQNYLKTIFRIYNKFKARHAKKEVGSRNKEKYSSNIYTEGLGDKGIKNVN